MQNPMEMLAALGQGEMPMGQGMPQQAAPNPTAQAIMLLAKILRPTGMPDDQWREFQQFNKLQDNINETSGALKKFRKYKGMPDGEDVPMPPKGTPQYEYYMEQSKKRGGPKSAPYMERYKPKSTEDELDDVNKEINKDKKE